MTTTLPISPARTALRWLWPVALAVVLAVLTTSDGNSPESVAGLAHALPLLPLLYLVVAAHGRPQATWATLVALVVPYVVVNAFDLAPPAAVAAAIAAAVLVRGAMSGRLRRSATFGVQALGMVGFGAFALAGLLLAPEPARYVVAAGWFLHGLWDLAHLLRGTVVSRSYALWCAVVDVLIAVELVFLG